MLVCIVFTLLTVLQTRFQNAPTSLCNDARQCKYYQIAPNVYATYKTLGTIKYTLRHYSAPVTLLNI